MAWWPANTEAKKQVDSGAIGKPWRMHGIVGHGGPGSGGASKHFFDWLTDPVKNGGGALVDFGCYSMLWSIWMKGMPESVYTSVLHLKPETYPKVEDNATIILNYKDGVAIFEGSWDLPSRPPSGNEIFGRTGSIVMGRPIELRKAGGRGQQQPEQIKVDPLPPERSNAIAYMVNRISTKQPLEGMTALDIHIQVQEVLEAAKISVKTGQAVRLPLKAK
jgi:predicted dehydrogenase